MSAHTPGKLEFHPTGILRICHGDFCAPIAEIRAPYRHGVGIVKGEHESQVNARRLAACWNACESLSQDALDGGWTAAGLSAHAKALEMDLAAARALLVDAADTFDEIPDEDHEIADRIRAFLVKGGAA